MTEHEFAEALRTVTGLLTVAGIIVSALLVLRTVFAFIRARRPLPALLVRDALLFGAVSISLFGSALWSLGGVPSDARPLWWVLFSGTITVVGVWGFAWWEWRVMRPRTLENRDVILKQGTCQGDECPALAAHMRDHHESDESYLERRP